MAMATVFENPISAGGENFDDENPLEQRGGAGGGAVAPTRDQLLMAFNRLDVYRAGQLGRDQVYQGLDDLISSEEALSDQGKEQIFQQMCQGGSGSDSVSFDEFASYWLTDSTIEVKRGGLGIKSSLQKRRQRKNRQRVQKSIRPESMFVVANSTEEAERQSAVLMDQIQALHEADFHHLEDSLNMHAESQMDLEVWDSVAQDSFDEVKISDMLQWSSEFLLGAKRSIAKEASTMVGEFAEIERIRSDLYRCFLKSRVRKHKLKQEIANSVTDVERCAAQFVHSSHEGWKDGNGIDQILDEETMSFDSACGAVLQSLRNEASFRQAKIDALLERKQGLAKNTPRRVKVVGLQGEAAAANGIYIADGLRASWGRPVYAQCSISGGDPNVTYYLFYDRTHATTASNGPAKSHWVDGCWVIGPSLNSSRCTAYLMEEVKGGKTEALLLPITDMASAPFWMVYDVVKLSWQPAPGDHAPFLDIIGIEGETLQNYIATTVKDQQKMRQFAVDKLESDTFAATIRNQLSKAVTDLGRITRKEYKIWMAKYHHNALKMIESGIIQDILLAHDTNRISLPPENDAADNQKLVSTIVERFVQQCHQNRKNRVIQKRKFLVRINRPTIMKAFFAWRVATRGRTTGGSSSSMFAEPELPWYVRHPHSSFTHSWEGIQALLLMYVAFTVVYRLSFNSPPEGIFLFLEILIDLYFVADVILNLHTAYYDNAGDLVGVHTDADGNPHVDLRTLYWNYAQGWFVIDVISVLPVFSTLFVDSGLLDTPPLGEEGKLFKSLRLLRLAKLLRLFRGMRIFQKYEEALGPVVTGLALITTIGWVMHSVACFWFVLGTMPSTGDAVSSKIGAVSVGWLQFTYNFNHCDCYGPASPAKWIRTNLSPTKQRNPEWKSTYYYDAFEDACIHTQYPNDKALETCTSHSQQWKANNLTAEVVESPPSHINYYVKSLFTVFKNPEINGNYVMTWQEMLYGIVATIAMGATWGAVAGSFSALFSANQMASQAYAMRIRQLKEFCRIKGLGFGVREKLEAHYHHLYPEKLIVDEPAVINDLPPQLREELVAELYGRQLWSVPLFLHLDGQIMTALCLRLLPLPALKGQVIAKEGSKGRQMFCISSGTIRITERIKDGDDTGRIKRWIEDVFSFANRNVVLIEPSFQQMVASLLKHMKRIVREKTRERTRLELEMAELNSTVKDKMQINTSKLKGVAITLADGTTATAYDTTGNGEFDAFDTTGDGTINALDTTGDGQVDAIDSTGDGQLDSFDTAGDGIVDSKDTTGDGKIDSLDTTGDGKMDAFDTTADGRFESRDTTGDGVIDNQVGASATAASSSWSAADAVHLRDLLFDDEVMDMVKEAGTQLQTLLNAAKRRNLISWSGALEMTDALPAGPELVANEGATVSEERPTEQLCEALQSGEHLTELLKLLSPQFTRLKSASTGLKSGVSAALADSSVSLVRTVVDNLIDQEGPFRMSPDVAFTPEDLKMCNEGSAPLRIARQKKILDTLSELGFIVSHMNGYMGPKLDDENLGTLGTGGFLGELSLLPIQGGWRHRRTATVLQNAMLSTLSKFDVDEIADKYPVLKHRMMDHAEDFIKAQASAAAAVGVDRWSKLQQKRTVDEHDAESGAGDDPLAVLKAQLSQQDVRLNQMSAALSEQDRKLDEIVKLLKSS